MRKVGSRYVQDKSIPARRQSEELCRAILAAQPKPIVLKTAGQYSKESAKCFRQAFRPAGCAVRCWFLCLCENLSKPRKLFHTVSRRYWKTLGFRYHARQETPRQRAVKHQKTMKFNALLLQARRIWRRLCWRGRGRLCNYKRLAACCFVASGVFSISCQDSLLFFSEVSI